MSICRNNEAALNNTIMKKSLAILLLAAMAAGCTTTRYVTVPEVRTDTLVKTNVQKDSIFLHDSIHVRERGDTILVDRWHTRYVEKLRRDTIYRSRVDSIAYPIEVIKEVPAKLMWWQQARLHLGGIALWLILIALIVGTFRLKNKITDVW